ncbi:hypothetical protein TNIN_142981 [Trichonephila inaurata madagascariensis]|uniref:Uncharacterized protein n=1 Tax=Trichonephila inaurata madagascariensis TaxID=2747483 RepID=A0A8X6MID4_9ARAC|nr:hypothetical protein TNIN_142981 [Trichonephila inaurata madagascariensis]
MIIKHEHGFNIKWTEEFSRTVFLPQMVQYVAVSLTSHVNNAPFFKNGIVPNMFSKHFFLSEFCFNVTYEMARNTLHNSFTGSTLYFLDKKHVRTSRKLHFLVMANNSAFTRTSVT